MLTRGEVSRSLASLKTILLLTGLTFATVVSAQPFPQAHAHNDYEHDHPLLDALTHGFLSVEADVHLVRNQMLVAHTRPIIVRRTLEELYLQPLDSIVRHNNGRVYEKYSGTFYLMIDIKGNAEQTFLQLNKVCDKFPALFDRKGGFLPVTIFLSGNRPIELVLRDPAKRMSIDGRPADLGKSYDPAFMPVVSDNFSKWSDWNGDGKPELRRVRELAKRVHAENKRLRLWAIPDRPNCWEALLDAGVDIINTDHLAELETFLRAKR